VAEPGDVLISIRAPVGPTNLNAVRSCIGRGLAAVRALGGVPAKYVLYALRATEEELHSRSTGTTFDAIRGDDLRNHSIPLAPLPEQHRIVAEIEKHFTRLDAAVASLRRARANLKRYRASVLKAACEGRLVPTDAELARREGRDYEPASVLLERILKERLARWEGQERRRGKYREPRPPDTSNLPTLPESWTWVTATQVSEAALGKMLDRKRTAGRPLPYLRNLNVRWNALDLSDLLEMPFEDTELTRYELNAGDVLVCEGGEPGRAAVWPGDERPIKYQKALHRVRLLGRLDPRWLVFNLWNDATLGRLEKYFTGTTIKHFTGVSFERYPLPLPPLVEQRRVVAEVERHLSVIHMPEASVEANLKRAERLRQAILRRAFEGKLVPQDPTDEPASVLAERIRAERGKVDTGGVQLTGRWTRRPPVARSAKSRT
jgi:type I restriction enzyme S subunit